MRKIFAFIYVPVFIALGVMLIQFIFASLSTGLAFFATFLAGCVLSIFAPALYLMITENFCTNLKHKWNVCVCENCKLVRDEQHDWDDCHCRRCGKIKENPRHDLVAETRLNCAYPNRGSGQYNDPCYGASCSDCEYTVYVCKTCGTECLEA